MMETIYLSGSEQVKSAANTMRAAAEDMQRAASAIDTALTLHQRFLDEWLALSSTRLKN
jgi:predicted small secreted protein